MSRKQLIHPQLEGFYEKASEETRLDKGMGVFEFERVKALMEKYLPTTPITILDVGGGTGKYSKWLSQKGHHVHLIDPVSKHIRIASGRSSQSSRSFHIHQGESRRLNFPNDFADMVILHGPLYHLPNEEDRIKTIQEAKRVLKHHGIILGFGISHTASTLVGLLNGLIHDPLFFQLCKEELLTGSRKPSEKYPWLLEEAFYHRPVQLKNEFINQGFAHITSHAVEGIAWLDKGFFSTIANPKRKQTLIELIELTEEDPSLLALSPHIMIVAQKN